MIQSTILPSGAIEDVRNLLGLTTDQLALLNELFSTGESAEALRSTFIETVASQLKISFLQARSVVVVCHFLLLRSEEDHTGEQLTDSLRAYVKNSISDLSEQSKCLEDFDSKRDAFRVLLADKPERVRAQKIRRLMRGPDRSIEDLRTVCQLRPLFDGPEHEEKIEGLVPTILLEIETSDTEDTNQVFSFSVDPDLLDRIEFVIARTKEKLDAIRTKYGSELLG